MKHYFVVVIIQPLYLSMKKLNLLFLAMAMIALSGCSVITGIFKVGVAVGVIVVLVVVVLIIWLIAAIMRK